MPPGFRAAEKIEVRPGEARTQEYKELEREVAPFIRPQLSMPVLPNGQVAGRSAGLQGFIEIGEKGFSPKVEFDLLSGERRPVNPLMHPEAPRLWDPIREPGSALEKVSEETVGNLRRMLEEAPAPLAVAAGITLFFILAGEAMADPGAATRMLMEGKESPVRVSSEGVPEGPTPMPKGETGSFIGFGEIGIIAGLVGILLVSGRISRWVFRKAKPKPAAEVKPEASPEAPKADAEPAKLETGKKVKKKKPKIKP